MKNRIFNNLLSQKLFTLAILTSVLGSAFSAGAQTRKVNSKTPDANKSKPTAQKCSGAWTGSVSYTRTQKTEYQEKGALPSGRGTADRRSTMDYNYSAKMMVAESPARDGKSVAKGSVAYTFDAIERIVTVEENSCDRGKTWRQMKGEHSSISQTSVSPTKVNGNVRVAVNANGTYSVGVSIPPTTGKTKGEQKWIYSNQCVKKDDVTIPQAEEQTSVDGNSLTSDSSHRINLDDPNRISGTYTLKLSETASETITWNLERCGAPLRITDLKFEHLLYPSPNVWMPIVKGGYTTDGNDVKVTATVANFSGESKRATVNFKELNENIDLPGGKVEAIVEPNEEKEVEFIWDTSGFSWKQTTPENRADFNRRIEASIPTDKKVGEVTVKHKPVVIVPGLWSKQEKFFRLVDLFKEYGWSATHAPVDIKKKALENASVIDKTVREVQEKYNAWHVDLVGHSTGGLAARAYVDGFMPGQYDNRPVATHLVMLGTPNLGTPCNSGVENIFAKIWTRNPDAFSEISYKNMKEFNKIVRSRHGTKFYAVAGDSSETTCQAGISGDGVVPFRSASALTSDYSLSDASHENLVNNASVFSKIRYKLAVPPKGDHAPDNSQASIDDKVLENADFGKSRKYGASFQPVNINENVFVVDDEPEPNFATGVKLKANQSTEIEIPVTAGSTFSLVLYTSPEISATLYDDKGEIVGTNLAGSPEAAEIFRMISLRKSFQTGIWKLKLESRAKDETETIVTTFIDYGSNAYRAK